MFADDKCVEQVLSEEERGEIWWKPFRDLLAQSTNTKAALLAAITAKSIALKLGKAAAVRQLLPAATSVWQRYLYFIENFFFRRKKY